MDERITKLELRMDQLEETVGDLRDGILGTMREPGLKNVAYNTHSELKEMRGEFREFREKQQQLIDQRNMGKGAWWLLCLICGFLSWATTMFFKK